MKRLLCTLSLSLLAHFAPAAPPAGYYATTDGLAGAPLKVALHAVIYDHTALPYTSSKTDVWDALRAAHVDPADSMKIVLIYSGDSFPIDQQDSGSGTTNVWNREHLWPNSYGIDDKLPKYTDVHNLVPALRSVNESRGNKYFDYSDPANSGYKAVAHAYAPDCSSDSDSWEPRDADKGYIARALLYMTTCYTDLELVDTPPATAPNSSSNRMAQLGMALEWNRRFPPGDFDRQRNDLVYSQFQHNRNPFSDYPEFADAIWVPEGTETYYTWRLRHFTLEQLDDAQASGDTANPDGDSLDNLAEAAFGTDPWTHNESPVQYSLDVLGQLVVRFPRITGAELSGLHIEVEASPTLAPTSWTVEDPATTVIIGDQYVETVVQTYTSTTTARFYRVRVRKGW